MKKLYRDVIDKLQPYIPGKPVAEVQRELSITDIIKMASNENPLGSSPKAISAIRKVLQDISFYPEGSCYELRKNLAKKLEISEENLIFGNGSDEILLMIGEAFLNPGDEVIQAVPELTFVEYKAITLVANGTPVFVELKNYTYDLEKMAEKVTQKTKLIFVANPNNPTGTIVTKTQVEEFLKKVPEDVIVVFDEAYYEYVERADYPESIDYVKEGRNVIVLKTFSKIYGLAGLRIGYGMAKKEIIDILEKVRQPFNVNYLAQVGANAALKDIKFVEESKRVNNVGKKYLYSSLDELDIPYVLSEANFIFIDLKKDAKPVVEKLMEEGVIVRKIGTGTTIRVTIGKEEQNKRFIEILKRIIRD
ncbi:MAG: histidinol-phosphate transaminase [Candidatus Firestonebacteria bacterium]